MAALLGMVLLAASCGEASRREAAAAPRIVSLVPTATETLFALGAGNLVVARSAYCDWPEEVLALPAIGDAVSVRVERVLALRPDLVLVGSAAQREALAPIRDKVRIEEVEPRSIADVRRTIAMLADATGRDEAGARILEEIDDALLAARERSREAPRRVVFVAQRTPLVVAGGASYVNELIEAVGAVNVAGDVMEEWPTLSLETLVARDPEVILDSRLDEPEDAAGAPSAWRSFTTLAAVKTGRVRDVRDPVLVRAGPRLPEALDLIERLVWEEPR